MQTPHHQQRLGALRDIIADIERKPALAETANQLPFDSTDAFPTLPGGLVQEIFTDEIRNNSASLGFALAQAKSLLTARRPTIFYLQLIREGQQFGLPYGPGLSWFGLEPARLVIVRVADMTEFLWAAEEIASCRAVAALVAEVKGEPKMLTFTASRRLSLRASSSKVSILILRYGRRRQHSAGHLRWWLGPQRSARNPYDDRAPGTARWQVRLEKGRIAGNRTDWLLEWTPNGFATLTQITKSHQARPEPAVSGAVSSLLGHRLSQAG